MTACRINISSVPGTTRGRSIHARVCAQVWQLHARPPSWNHGQAAPGCHAHCMSHYIALSVTLCHDDSYTTPPHQLHYVTMSVILRHTLSYTTSPCQLHYVALSVTLRHTVSYITSHCQLHYATLSVSLTSFSVFILRLAKMCLMVAQYSSLT